MNHLGLITVSAAILSFALTLAAAPQPAAAGKACRKLNLGSPCIAGRDIKPSLKLGRSGNDGDLIVRTATKATGVSMDGDSGNVTNIFSNSADQSNGLVKAWAQINADGTIVACWRCNMDPSETRSLVTGEYEVDFTPLSTDITGRPRLAVPDDHLISFSFGEIALGIRLGDASSVLAITRNSTGVKTSVPFTIIIF